jgi:phage FluMu gp28-like protein
MAKQQLVTQKPKMTKGQVFKRLREDPIFFCRLILGFAPYWYQKDLLSTKSKRIVAVWGRQSGKTTTIAAKVIHFCFTNADKNVLIISKGLRQSMLMYSIIQKMILDKPILANSIVRITNTQIWLSNGSSIIALPCSTNGANLRGFTADMIIMDEAAFMPEIVITQVIYPMLATTRGTAIMLSTPFGRNHIFYRAFVDKRYWSQRVLSKDCPKIDAEFLDEQLALIGQMRFDIEYNAMFLEDATALFTQDMISACVQKWGVDDKLYTDNYLQSLTTKLKGRYVLGSDLGKRMDFSVIVILKFTRVEILDKESGRPLRIRIWKIVYLKEFPLKTKLSRVMSHIKWLATKITIKYACIDQTGIGEAAVEELGEQYEYMEGVQMYSAQTKHKIVQYGYLMVEREQLAIPDFRKESGVGGGNLITQMAEQSFSYSKVKVKIETEERGILTYSHPEGKHDDKLFALLLALYATRNA